MRLNFSSAARSSSNFTNEGQSLVSIWENQLPQKQSFTEKYNIQHIFNPTPKTDNLLLYLSKNYPLTYALQLGWRILYLGWCLWNNIFGIMDVLFWYLRFSIWYLYWCIRGWCIWLLGWCVWYFRWCLWKLGLVQKKRTQKSRPEGPPGICSK